MVDIGQTSSTWMVTNLDIVELTPQLPTIFLDNNHKHIETALEDKSAEEPHITQVRFTTQETYGNHILDECC